MKSVHRNIHFLSFIAIIKFQHCNGDKVYRKKPKRRLESSFYIEFLWLQNVSVDVRCPHKIHQMGWRMSEHNWCKNRIYCHFSRIQIKMNRGFWNTSRTMENTDYKTQFIQIIYTIISELPKKFCCRKRITKIGRYRI